MFNVFLPIALIFIGLSSGYLFQRMVNSGNLTVSTPLIIIRKRLQSLSLLWLTPFPLITSVWIAPWKHLEIVSMPFIGVSVLLFGASSAYIISRIMKQSRKDRAMYVICGGFTNLGNLGTLLVFFLLGERGFAFISFYSLLERVFYFVFGFPYAKQASIADQATTGNKGMHRNAPSFNSVLISIFSPYIMVTLVSIGIGVILNLADVPRPEIFGEINNVVIPVNSLVFLSSIGMAIRFGQVLHHIKPALMMLMIKSVLSPLFAAALGLLFGLHTIEGGLPLKVVILLASMPVGLTALVPPTLYDLNIDLANTNWIITNFALLLTVPLVWMGIGLL